MKPSKPDKRRCPSSGRVLAVAERIVARAEGPGFEFRIKGATARLTIVQPTFDAEGRFLGEARVTVEGQRRWGGMVEFTEPLAITVTGAPPGEEEEFRRMGRFAVEALTEPEPTP